MPDSRTCNGDRLNGTVSQCFECSLCMSQCVSFNLHLIVLPVRNSRRPPRRTCIIRECNRIMPSSNERKRRYQSGSKHGQYFFVQSLNMTMHTKHGVRSPQIKINRIRSIQPIAACKAWTLYTLQLHQRSCHPSNLIRKDDGHKARTCCLPAEHNRSHSKLGPR